MDVRKKITISTIFFVPTLGINRAYLENQGINFINGYIKDAGREVQYENCVYLLFKPINWDFFQDFVDEEYERTTNLIDDYDYEGGFVVMVYQLNPEYEVDFGIIKRGRYSKTSQEFQSLFPKIKKIIKNGKYMDEISLQLQIFNKSEGLREYWEDKFGVSLTKDMEVWSGFQEEDEILDVTKIKELV